MTSKLLSIMALTAALALAPLRADARMFTMVFGPPFNTVVATVDVIVLRPALPPVTVPVAIPPGSSAFIKAFLIGSALANAGFNVVITPGGLPVVVFPNLPSGAVVAMVDHGTGEQPDKIKFGPPPAASPPPLPFQYEGGQVNYGTGQFAPVDWQNQPAIFTAGIITDVGELSVQVSAAELNFQTDGPIICQALFQRLAPLAPQYGAQVNYAGDRLEVYFDPAYTTAGGGIIFGNTSRQGDSGASLTAPPESNPPPVEFKFSQPLNPVPAQIMLDLTVAGQPPANFPVLINPGDTVLAKRDKVVDAFRNAGAAPTATASDKCLVGNLAPGSMVRMTDMGTCEANDSIKSRGVTQATAGFPGHFAPNAPNNQPAIFTAGIVTDVGTLSVQVSSAELNFQTDGPIICQALFQRLVPQAPQYGAQINYAGDRLEIYFDPAYTVTQGGILFGTSSPTPGNFGSIFLPPAVPVLPGDMNCDGVVNALDIAPLVKAITDPAGYAQEFPECNIQNGDINGDGSTDIFDIDPFVPMLTN